MCYFSDAEAAKNMHGKFTTDDLEVIAKALVDDPASVKVEETIDGDTTVCTLSVAEADMGKVIGKSGKIAKAIRSIIKSASIRAEKKVVLEIK